MKSVIKHLARAEDDLSQDAFATKYKAAHPMSENLNDEAIRQAFAQYRTVARRLAKNCKPCKR